MAVPGILGVQVVVEKRREQLVGAGAVLGVVGVQVVVEKGERAAGRCWGGVGCACGIAEWGKAACTGAGLRLQRVSVSRVNGTSMRYVQREWVHTMLAAGRDGEACGERHCTARCGRVDRGQAQIRRRPGTTEACLTTEVDAGTTADEGRNSMYFQ